MRFAIVLLVLCLISSFSLAEAPQAGNPLPCIDKKAAYRALLNDGFQIRAEMEQEGYPSAIFSNDKGDWVVIILARPEIACIAAGGKAFRIIMERKA